MQVFGRNQISVHTRVHGSEVIKFGFPKFYAAFFGLAALTHYKIINSKQQPPKK
jgi:hypothetical protein